jgi:hypothetical protein
MKVKGIAISQPVVIVTLLSLKLSSDESLVGDAQLFNGLLWKSLLNLEIARS